MPGGAARGIPPTTSPSSIAQRARGYASEPGEHCRRVVELRGAARRGPLSRRHEHAEPLRIRAVQRAGGDRWVHPITGRSDVLFAGSRPCHRAPTRGRGRVALPRVQRYVDRANRRPLGGRRGEDVMAGSFQSRGPIHRIPTGGRTSSISLTRTCGTRDAKLIGSGASCPRKAPAAITPWCAQARMVWMRMVVASGWVRSWTRSASWLTSHSPRPRRAPGRGGSRPARGSVR
jgi:hypothetical protein